MIKDEDYSKVLDSGLSLDHYFLLCQMRDEQKLIENRRVLGFKRLLEKKGYIKDDIVTEKGLQLIHSFDRNEKMEVIKGVLKRKVQVATGEWLSSLYEKCLKKLEEVTGKKQISQKIKGKSFYFMPNYKDFENSMTRAIKAYNLKDFNRIETVVLNYIEKCSNEKNWFPLLRYYFIKDNHSEMVTDMENPDEDVSGNDYQSNQRLV